MNASAAYCGDADYEGSNNNMGTYWLLDRHGADGPSILVETDGSMRVIEVLRFGPEITELEDQQRVWDDVVDKIAPTMKPFVAEAELAEEGVEVHPDLQHGESSGDGSRRRGARKRGGSGSGRTSGGPKRTGGRGRG